MIESSGLIGVEFGEGGLSILDNSRRPRLFRIDSGSNPYSATEVYLKEVDGTTGETGVYVVTAAQKRLYETNGNSSVKPDTIVEATPNQFGVGFYFTVSGNPIDEKRYPLNPLCAVRGPSGCIVGYSQIWVDPVTGEAECETTGDCTGDGEGCEGTDDGCGGPEGEVVYAPSGGYSSITASNDTWADIPDPMTWTVAATGTYTITPYVRSATNGTGGDHYIATRLRINDTTVVTNSECMGAYGNDGDTTQDTAAMVSTGVSLTSGDVVEVQAKRYYTTTSVVSLIVSDANGRSKIHWRRTG